VYQKEKGEEGGNVHFQGYVVYKNARALVGVRKVLPTAHWEIAKGDADQNRVYCTKDDTRLAGTAPSEFGVKPSQVRTRRRPTVI